MDRIRELLGRVTELSDQELSELRDLILSQIDANGETAPDSVELSLLEELAEASTAVRGETERRQVNAQKRTEAAATLAEFKTASQPPAPEVPPVVPEVPAAPEVVPPNEPAINPDGSPVVAGGTPEVPAGREPQVPRPRTTAITAAADIPGWSMGVEFKDANDIARAMADRLDTLRGSSGGNGEKVRVAHAELTSIDENHRLRLRGNDSEGNLAKVMAATSPEAITAAGGLGAFRETVYDLFGMLGDTNRPVRDSLPVFRTDRGGVRFMRPPTLNDVNGVVGIWTVQNDIDAATNPAIRKPSFRVLPGPEIVVDTQAITMIMTFGNLMTRAYPELVRRHNELGLVAHARVAEQQLLTQIGALSTAVTGRTQVLGATREFLLTVDKATASYRNRHRMNNNAPMRIILPQWFQNLLRADVGANGESLDNLGGADAKIAGWFASRNLNVTWAMDGEAGQDYSSMTSATGGAGGTVGVADFPTSVIWYLFAEGTFSFMDGGTLDLGLVRDSTLNAANDYQMFVETFENIVKFGYESYRVRSNLKATGAWAAGTAYTG
jgi:hypothetical protein